MPMGLLPYWEDGELVAAATNMGVIFNVDGNFTWRSSLSVEPDVYWNGFDVGGTPLIGTSKGLMITEDKGCNWTTLADLSDESIMAFATLPFSSSAHLIGTSTPAKSNAIYKVNSAGGWDKIASSEIDGLYTAIQYASGSKKFVALSESENAGAHQLHQADEDAMQWSSQSLELTFVSDTVRLLGIAGEGGEYALIAAWVPRVEDSSGTKADDHLIQVNLTNGEQTLLGTIGPYAKFLYAAGQHASGILATDSDDILHKYNGTELVASAEDTRHCINDKLLSGKLVACGERPQDHVFYTSSDGIQWEGLLAFDDIELDPCPEESQAGNGSQTTVNNNANSKKGAGGCACVSTTPMGWFLVAGVILFRRRRFETA